MKLEPESYHFHFLSMVEEFMDDFGFSEEEAKKVVHELMKEEDELPTNSHEELLAMVIPNCKHCAGGL